MGKASKRQAEEEELAAAEDEVAEEAPVSKKKGKKSKLASLQEEEEAADVAPKDKKSKKEKRAAAEEEPVAEEEEPAPKEKKKKKKAKLAVEEVAEEEEEPAPLSKKEKKAKKAAAAAEEVADEEPAPMSKKEKKAKKAAAVEEGEDEQVEELAPKAEKKKKEKKTDEGEEEDGNAESEELTVFIGGIPFSCDEATLRKDFSECGEIEKMNLPMNEDGRPKGIAFITFKSKEGVAAACKFDGDDYGGRTLKVNVAGAKGSGKGDKGKSKGEKGKGNNENTAFVRGLPWGTTEDALRKDFAECGEIESLRMPLNEDGQCKGIAFIQYKEKEGLEKAKAYHETDYGGRTIYVGQAGEPTNGKGKDGKGKDGGGKGNNDLTVCVRGLPFATTEEALRKDFAECGELERCKMLLNENGECKGTAFIEYKNKEGLEKAMAFNETDYGGRTIYVSKAGEGGKGKDGKGKDGKGKGKGKDGKGKKGKKGKASSEAFAKNTGAIVEGQGEKKTFDDSDSDE